MWAAQKHLHLTTNAQSSTWPKLLSLLSYVECTCFVFYAPFGELLSQALHFTVLGTRTQHYSMNTQFMNQLLFEDGIKLQHKFIWCPQWWTRYTNPQPTSTACASWQRMICVGKTQIPYFMKHVIDCAKV